MLYGIIAGTGIDRPDTKRRWETIETEYGDAHAAIIEINNQKVVFMRRHGVNMTTPPHLINHMANMMAMKDYGVKYIFATAAVGSLRKEIEPGSIAIVKDFIDFTRSRNVTIFNKIGDELNHTDFSHPYSNVICEAFLDSADSLGYKIHKSVVYMSVDGPRYETPAEVRMFADWGADVIGMTGAPEAILAKEMGMEYGSIALVSNYAAGISDKALKHEDVIAAVDNSRLNVLNIIETTIISLSNS